MSDTPAPEDPKPPQTFTATAVETVHVKYEIQADSLEQAEGRLRKWFGDPDAIKEGVVVMKGVERVRWQIRGGSSKKK